MGLFHPAFFPYNLPWRYATAVYSCLTACAWFVCTFLRRRTIHRKHGRRMSAMSRMMAETAFLPARGMSNYTISAGLHMPRLPTDQQMTDIVVNHLLPFKRLRSVPVGWYWEEVDVKVENHIRRIHIDNPADVAKHLEDVVNTPLDRKQPLWQFVLFENVNKDASQGAFISKYDMLIFRVEHCVGDGVSLVEVLSQIFTDSSGVCVADLAAVVGLQRKCSLQVKRSARRLKRQDSNYIKQAWIDVVRTFSWIKHAVLGIAIKFCMSLPFVVLSAFGRYDSHSACSAPLDIKKRGMMFCSKQTVATTNPLSLQTAKKIRGILRVSLNDVLMSCFAGAVRRYNIAHGCPTYDKPPPVECKALVPYAFLRPSCSFATDEGALRNEFVFMSLPICTNEPTALLRTKATNKATSLLKYRLQPLWNYLCLRLMTALSLTMARHAGTVCADRHSFVFANVPGPQFKAFVCGIEIKGLQAFFANLLPQVEILSYAGKLFFNVVADPTVIADPHKLVGYFAEELQQLAQSLGIEDDVWYHDDVQEDDETCVEEHFNEDKGSNNADTLSGSTSGLTPNNADTLSGSTSGLTPNNADTLSGSTGRLPPNADSARGSRRSSFAAAAMFNEEEDEDEMSDCSSSCAEPLRHRQHTV